MARGRRTERFELRLTPDEKELLEKAANEKDLSIADFVRQVVLEMARAIVLDKSPDETAYAVLMSAGRLEPSVVSATADFLEQVREKRGIPEYPVIDVFEDEKTDD